MQDMKVMKVRIEKTLSHRPEVVSPWDLHDLVFMFCMPVMSSWLLAASGRGRLTSSRPDDEIVGPVMAKKSRGRRKATRGPQVSPTAAAVAMVPLSPVPPHRRLKVFSLDPAADARLEHSLISRSVLPVAWESLAPGPVGEYLEVVDVDPSSGCVYDPIDLSEPDLLAQDGLSPSSGNPQFHQQMVYAVAMKTIANFEEVLGRKILWAERQRDSDGRFIDDPAARYVRRLRIYPHALREQNAYYSPAKAALLFGYFNAPTTDPRDELPGGVVFSCLSHDIIAHETTHAILDGMHRQMLDPSNRDMVAFHEAFADIVAIFQHFTMPGLLLDQIARTRGSLESNSLLAQLAAQFARATGRGDALRNALGTFKKERREPPDPSALGRTSEPHERGAILVAAVFDAFLRMYETRVADLRRIATGGTGVLPKGDIHPDLATRFAEEAVQLSQRVLNMCIRAIDYLPPVDVTFGDYLRAVVTADADFYPDDPRRSRLAFIESFRDRGIYPLDVRALAEDALRWTQFPADADAGASAGRAVLREILPPPPVLRTMASAYDSTQQMLALLRGNQNETADTESVNNEIWNDFRAKNFDGAAQRFLAATWQPASLSSAPDRSLHGQRYPRYQMERMFAQFLHGWIAHKARANPNDAERNKQVAWHLGLDFKSLGTRNLKLEVRAVRPTVRLRSDGRSKVELLVVLVQRRRVELLSDPQDPSSPVMLAPDGTTPLTFSFRGGATLIIDPETGGVTYAIGKNILSQGRLERQMAYLHEQLTEQGTAAIARFGLTEDFNQAKRSQEPFAVAHSSSRDAGTY